MKSENIKCIQNDVGLHAWQFIDIDKFMDKSRATDSLTQPQDFINLLIGNVGELARFESYKKYGSKPRIELQITLSDTLFCLFNLIRANGFSILDIVRIGLYRYKEKIWTFKKVKK